MNTIIRQALLLASKDTRIFFRDRAAMAFAFLLPFIFVIGFSLALRDVGPETEELQFYIATQETVGISIPAVEAISSAADGPVKAMEHSEALAALNSGEISGFVSFPPNFTQRFLSGEPAQLDAYVGDIPVADEAALRGFAQRDCGPLFRGPRNAIRSDRARQFAGYRADNGGTACRCRQRGHRDTSGAGG